MGQAVVGAVGQYWEANGSQLRDSNSARHIRRLISLPAGASCEDSDRA